MNLQKICADYAAAFYRDVAQAAQQGLPGAGAVREQRWQELQIFDPAKRVITAVKQQKYKNFMSDESGKVIRSPLDYNAEQNEIIERRIKLYTDRICFHIHSGYVNRVY